MFCLGNMKYKHTALSHNLFFKIISQGPNKNKFSFYWILLFFKYGIAFLGLLIAQNTHSQTYKYQPFLGTSDWKVKSAFFTDSTVYWYTKIFETTIDFKVYTAISYCDSLDPLIYIRENTTSRKVYYMNPNDMTEHVLYDFSLKVGDKAYMSLQMNYNIAREFQVTQIDTVIVNGSKRKKFYYMRTSGSDVFEALEGVGCLSEPFKIISPVFDPVYYLLCAYSGKTLQYSFNQACSISPCYNPSSIKDVSTDVNPVYPNPCTDKLIINCPVETLYELHDLSGQLVLQGVEKESIYVSDLRKGMYILVLKREGYEERFKIAKE
jgi:hypothetical protein